MTSFMVTEELERWYKYRGKIIGNGKIFDYRVDFPSGDHSLRILELQLDAEELGYESQIDHPQGPSVTVSENGRDIPIDREILLDIMGGWAMATAALTAFGTNKGKYTFPNDTLVERLSK